MVTNVNDFLAHYGEKGMKWGVRRSRNGEPTKASSRARAKKMSDDELKTAIGRLELEKKYVDLNSQTQHAGRKYAQGLLEQAGKGAVGTAVGVAVGALVGGLVKSKFQQGSGNKNQMKLFK